MSLLKSTDDIAKLRIGGKRLARAVAETAKLVVPGVTTQELNDHFEKLVRETGDMPSFLGYKPRGAKRPFPSAICISVNEEVVHGIPTENPRTIQEGDIVKLDGGVTHEGLITDHAVSVIAGGAKPEIQELMDATREAMLAGIAAARGGNKVGDIAAAVEAVGVKYGLGIVYELGGHGVGHAVHEEPYVPNVGDAGTGVDLVPNMVIAIEPMFTLGTPKVKLLSDGYTFITRDNTWAAHWEHTILITEGDPEILTAL